MISFFSNLKRESVALVIFHSRQQAQRRQSRRAGALRPGLLRKLSKALPFARYEPLGSAMNRFLVIILYYFIVN